MKNVKIDIASVSNNEEVNKNNIHSIIEIIQIKKPHLGSCACTSSEVEIYGVTFSLNYLRSIKHSPNPDLLNKYCGLKAVLDSL